MKYDELIRELRENGVLEAIKKVSKLSEKESISIKRQYPGPQKSTDIETAKIEMSI